jgi:hypothetical protein
MKKLALIMALAALVCWLPGQALATTYGLTIYDPPANQADGTVTATLSGFSSGNYSVTTGNEYASGWFKDGTWAFNDNSKITVIFTEAGGGNSDFLTISTADNGGWPVSTANFLFESDGATVNGSTFAYDVAHLTGTVYSVAETGGLQDVTSKFECLMNFCTVNVKVQSDLDAPAVPIPPSVLLMGSGLLGMVGFAWRKRS